MTTAANESIITRLMEPHEASQLQDLLRRCYGESYFDSLYYDADALAQAIATQQHYSMVAINPAGEFVAHIALRNHRESLTADTSMAIVDPRYRSNGLFVEIGAQMMPIYQQLGLCGLYLQSVTVHPYSQHSSLKGHAGVTGVYLNYIPAATRFLEMDAAIDDNGDNPVATKNGASVATPVVIMIQPLAAMPARSVVWPSYYRQQIEQAFKQCNMQRDTATPQRLAAETRIRVEKKPRQKIVNLWFDAIGSDWQVQFESALNSFNDNDYNAVYLQLPLNKYLLDDCIKAAKAQGFFYAGVLAEYAKQDWLGLQKLDRSTINRQAIHLVGEQSNQIFDFIMQD